MAKKKGGFFHAMGNLARWTIWGLAAVLVIAIWLGWSNRDTVDVAGSEVTAAGESAGEDVAAVEETAEADASAAEGTAAAESASSEAEETVSEESAPVDEVEATEPDAGDVAEGAMETVADAVEDVIESPTEEATDEALAEAEDASGTAPSAGQDVAEAVEGAVTDEEADLNVLPDEVREITVPGDDATYGLVSVFQRDDGRIEVVSSRTEGGTEVLTTRLVTCAPLSVGVIAEGDGPREEDPEMERIALGGAAATIAAVACGAMN